MKNFPGRFHNTTWGLPIDSYIPDGVGLLGGHLGFSMSNRKGTGKHSNGAWSLLKMYLVIMFKNDVFIIIFLFGLAMLDSINLCLPEVHLDVLVFTWP